MSRCHIRSERLETFNADISCQVSLNWKENWSTFDASKVKIFTFVFISIKKNHWWWRLKTGTRVTTLIWDLTRFHVNINQLESIRSSGSSNVTFSDNGSLASDLQYPYFNFWIHAYYRANSISFVTSETNWIALDDHKESFISSMMINNRTFNWFFAFFMSISQLNVTPIQFNYRFIFSSSFAYVVITINIMLLLP